MGELSPWHWAIAIAVFVLLFGAKRLPDAARSLGRSARILKAELKADAPKADEQVAPVVTSEPAAAAPASTTPVTTPPATAGIDPIMPPAPVQKQPETVQH